MPPPDDDSVFVEAAGASSLPPRNCFATNAMTMGAMIGSSCAMSSLVASPPP